MAKTCVTTGVHPFFTAHHAGDRRARLQREATTTRLVRSAQLTPVRRLRVRALDPTDIRHLDALYNGLSPRSRFLRFMSPIATVPAAILERLAAIDHDRHEAIGAFDRNGLVASAHWFRREDDPGCAELATEVADRYQRQGVGSRLLLTLGSHARARGISVFDATLLGENAGAKALLRATGWPMVSVIDGSELTVAMTIDATRRIG